MYPAEAGHSRPPGTVDTQWTPTRSVRDERYATREAVELFRICHHARWKPGTVGTQWTPTRSLAPSRGGGEGWQEVTKVLLGASGLLSNGHVISRVMIILLYYYSIGLLLGASGLLSNGHVISRVPRPARFKRAREKGAKRARKGREKGASSAGRRARARQGSGGARANTRAGHMPEREKGASPAGALEGRDEGGWGGGVGCRDGGWGCGGGEGAQGVQTMMKPLK